VNQRVFGTYGSGGPDALTLEGYYSDSDGGCSVPTVLQKTGGSTTLIADGGGAILQNAIIWLIYWGATWKSDSSLAGLKTMIDHNVHDLLLGMYSVYFSKLSQYSSINPPTWGGSVVEDTIALPSNGMAFNSIGTFVKQCISNGTVPKPDVNNWQIFYCVILKPGRYETSGGAAAHISFTYP